LSRWLPRRRIAGGRRRESRSLYRPHQRSAGRHRGVRPRPHHSHDRGTLAPAAADRREVFLLPARQRGHARLRTRQPRRTDYPQVELHPTSARVNRISPRPQHGQPFLVARSGNEKEKCTMTIGYDKPLYVLPFDHRATFSKNMFGWQGPLSPEQTAEIAAV